MPRRCCVEQRRPFANAREPLAQAFKAVGDRRRAAFGVIVNHFKSKSRPALRRQLGTGQGASNGDRIRQAHGAGDVRRPVQASTAAPTRSSWPVTSTPTPRRTRCRSSYGARVHRAVESDHTGEYVATASTACPARSTTCWPTRPRWPTVDRRRHLGDQRRGVGGLRVQPVQLQRHGLFYEPNPFARLRPRPGDRRAERHRRRRRDRRSWASTTSTAGSPTNTTNAEAGAAVLAGAVKQMRRGTYPNTVFAAAGDLIGASDVRVVHPERQADHRRAQRGRPGRLGGRQPRVRPGLRRPGQPGDGAVRRRSPTRWAGPAGSTWAPTSESRGRLAGAA